MILYSEEEFQNSKGTDKLKIQCDYCNNIFTSPKRNIVRKINKNEEVIKYCSSKCSMSAINENKRVKLKCTQCNSDVEKLPSQMKKSKTGKFFCNQSCAATYNNQSHIAKKRPYTGKYCETCNKKIRKTSTKNKCTNCIQDCYKAMTLKETQERLSVKGKHSSWINSIVRLNNRSWNKDLTILPCKNCGYDKHVELCHIKAITSFPETSTLGEINHSDNIIQLCRNCHWEFDNGYLALSS